MLRILSLVFISFFVLKNSYSSPKFPLPDFITNISVYIKQKNPSVKITSTSQITLIGKKLNVVSIKILSENTRHNNKLASLIILLKELEHEEMAFNLLFLPNNMLLGVFPTTKEKGRLIGLKHINFSEYYLSLKTIKSKEWSLWEHDLQRIKEYNSIIEKYCLQLGMDPDRDLMRKPDYDRKVWTSVRINKNDTSVQLMEFDLLNFNEDDKNKYFNKGHICFPILPTVFSPSKETNLLDEELTATLFYKSLHFQDKTKSLLEVGTGSGYYLWIAFKFAKDNKFKLNLFGLDINPVAVENAKILSQLGGYRANIIVHNNIVAPEGKDEKAAFRNKKFDYIVWNMPQIPKNFKDSIIYNEIPTEKSNSHVSYWDSGINGINALARFAKYLPMVLNSNGKALIWNIIPDSGIDVVKNTFEHYGFSVKSLDKHYSDNYRETTIVYELTH